MSAAGILHCRPEIAESIAQFVRNKVAADWSDEAITTHLQQMSNPITKHQVRQLIAEG